MRHKTITLDPTAYEYAKTIPNFSKFVRECLHAHANGEDIVSAMRQRQHWKDYSDKVAEALDDAMDTIRKLNGE